MSSCRNPKFDTTACCINKIVAVAPEEPVTSIAAKELVVAFVAKETGITTTSPERVVESGPSHLFNIRKLVIERLPCPPFAHHNARADVDELEQQRSALQQY